MHPLRQLGRITARIVAWTAGIALGLVLLAGIAVTIVLSTEGGTRALAGLLDQRSIGGQTVTLEGVSGSFHQTVAVDRLSLSDDDGEWLEVRELKLQWRPADLLRGRVQIGLLTAQRVTTKRAPAAGEPDDTDPEPIKLPRIPDLPIRLVIDHLGVGELSLPRGPGTALQVTGDWRGRRIRLSGFAHALGPEKGWAAIHGNLEGRRAVLALGSMGTTAWFGEDQGERFLSHVLLDGSLRAGAARLLTSSGERIIDGDARWDREGLTAELVARGFDLADAPGLGGPWRASVQVDRGRRPTLDVEAEGDEVLAEMEARTPRRRGGEAQRLALTWRLEPRESADLPLALISWNGTLSASEAGFALDGTASGQDLGLDGFQVDSFSGPLALDVTESAVDLRWLLTADTLRLAQFGARTFGGSTGGRASLDRTTRRLSLENLTARLGTTELAIDGDVSFDGDGNLKAHLQMPEALPPLSGRLSRAELHVGARLKTWTRMDLDVRGKAEASDDLPSPVLAGQTFDVGGKARLEGRSLEVQTARLTSDRLSAEGSGTWSRAEGFGDVRLDATVKPGPLAPSAFADRQVLAALTLSGPAAQPKLRAEVTAERLTVSGTVVEAMTIRADTDGLSTARLNADARLDGQPFIFEANARALQTTSPAFDIARLRIANTFLSGSARVSDGRLQADARIEQVAGTFFEEATLNIDAGPEQGSIVLDESTLSVGPLALDALELTYARTSGQVPWTWQTDIIAEPLQLTAQGQADPQRFTMTALDGRFARTVFSLAEPIIVSPQGGSGAVNIGEGSFTLDAGSGWQQATASLRDLPARVVNPLVRGLITGGQMTADVQLRRDDAWQVDGAAELSDLSVGIAGRPRGDRLNASLEVSASPERARFSLDARSAAGAKAEIAVMSEAGATTAFADDAQIEGSGRIEGPLSPLVTPFLNEEQRITGLLQGELSANGTLAEPLLRGRLQVREGVVEDARAGIEIRQLQATAAFTGPRVRVEGSGTDGRGGRIELSGQADLATRLRELNLMAEDFEVLSRRGAQARADADLTFTASPKGRSELTGEVRLRRLALNIEEILPGGEDVKPLTVDEEVGRPEHRQLTDDERAEVPDFPIRFDVRVQADRRVYLRSDAADTEWFLDVRAKGTPQDVRLDGRAEALQGAVTALGVEFEVERAVLRFDGEPMDTAIDARATHAYQNGTAILTATGTVKDPTIDLTSEPQLPDSEILSRILFNEDSGDLSALQAAQLSAALASFATGEDFDVVSRVRDRLGLDELSIDAGDEGPTVTAGRYITESLFVEFASGGEGSLGSTRIAWYLRPQVVLASEVDSEGDANLSLEWTIEF